MLADNIFTGVIQYNNDNRAFEGGPIPLNVNDVCEYMTNGTNVLTQYAAVNKCVSVSTAMFYSNVPVVLYSFLFR